MQRGLILTIVRFVLTGIIAAVAFGSWFYAFRYYEMHKENIWIQIGEVADAITLPFKLARLYSEPPLIEIPVPVYGVRVQDIADTWGEARSEGRIHEGTDIFAERGTPVFAATRGYVLRTGTNNLGGIVVLTAGPGGIRYYYAHLDRIADGIHVGMPVTTDTVIGFVGNTGNASGAPPHLHFGMFQHGPQNPYPLLIDRE
jgi:peptidoglycan LD-endopeptidase LytH